MKKHDRSKDRESKKVELDQKTIAGLEIDDHDADRLKGGGSGSRGGSDQVGGGTLTAL